LGVCNNKAIAEKKMFEEEEKDWIDRWMDHIGRLLCLIAATGSLLLLIIMIFLVFYWGIKIFVGI